MLIGADHYWSLVDIEFVDGKYQVRLPFKEDHQLLPDNFQVAKSRLCSVLRRLRSNPQVLRQYDEVIKEHLDRGVIEKVEPSPQVEVGRVHYLPHHEVVRADNLTTKIRVVNDASSCPEKNLPSLNNCLYAGEPMTPLIYDILLRFRAHKIAFIGDIEKAFLNISVKPSDRDYLRFLWVNDVGQEKPQVGVYQFTRVAFGLCSSPLLLSATLHHHLTNHPVAKKFAEEVMNSMYVDDYVGGADNETSALEKYSQLKSCFQDVEFNISYQKINITYHMQPRCMIQ